jgi:hypothetical protein
MPHIRDTAADLADTEPLVRVGVAREESEAAHWVEALARAGIEAAVEIADGAAVAPGRTTWSGQFFVYPVLVPERHRDRAEQVVGGLIAGSEDRRTMNAIGPVAAIVGLVLLVVVAMVVRGN